MPRVIYDETKLNINLKHYNNCGSSNSPKKNYNHVKYFFIQVSFKPTSTNKINYLQLNNVNIKHNRQMFSHKFYCMKENATKPTHFCHLNNLKHKVI